MNKYHEIYDIEEVLLPYKQHDMTRMEIERTEM